MTSSSSTLPRAIPINSWPTGSPTEDSSSPLEPLSGGSKTGASHDERLLRHQRAEFINPGPDHLWCIDGHDKLKAWGIHIYAAIDAYSRKIIWTYVGNANRSRLAVARQYLETAAQLDWCPRFIRADRGQE